MTPQPSLLPAEPWPGRVAPNRSYDDIQAQAVLICWLCCGRTVYSTHPERGCLRCR